MAITIKSVPALRGKAADKFVSKANNAVKERATIDYSKQRQTCTSILNKAQIK